MARGQDRSYGSTRAPSRHQGSISCFQMCVVVIWCLLEWNSCGESWNLPQSSHVQQFIQTKLDPNFLNV